MLLPCTVLHSSINTVHHLAVSEPPKPKRDEGPTSSPLTLPPPTLSYSLMND